ncbi:MAG TPA: DUF1559 domain-containing protein [Pirellulales bacterium]|nr:DUF1559 domain-containing protein [Pirellulales bacterium]
MFQRSRPLFFLAFALTLLLADRSDGQDSDKLNKSRDNLKQIGLAFHNYHDVFDRFPTSTRDKEGKPLLSWRVEILPFVGAMDLYNRFHLDEPWDSEHNRKLIAEMPKVFKAPGVKENEKTVYLEAVGPQSLFPRDKSDPRQRQEVPRVTVGDEASVLAFKVGIRDVHDGLSNTILVVEADPRNAVIWTKPDDLAFDAKKPKAGLGGVFDGGFNSVLGDGSVRFVPLTTDEKVLLDLFNPADGHPIPDGVLK